MARYDYRCTVCDKVFEVEHGMLEHPEVVCPDCGGVATRVFDASGIVFKGTGFYNTDQRGGQSATPATSETNALAKTGNGTKQIKRRSDGPSQLAKNSDRPAKVAAEPAAKASAK
ncbi:MAG: FmdB family zinc ribbon protein [Coriobacteriales bacterium]|jgi:putative FmdB family regulatory protein